MEFNQRKTVFEDLKVFDPGAPSNSFIEVTEWTNGDGVDITISRGEHEKVIGLSHDEIEAINYLIQSIRYN